MGGGESVVGITSEQVCVVFNDTNYGEQAESLGGSGIVVRLVGFWRWLVKGGEHLLEIEPPSDTIHVGRVGLDVNGRL